MEMIGIREIPSFQTLAKRAGSLNMHTINREIAFLYAVESIAAIDSFMVHTCKYSTAARRRVWVICSLYHLDSYKREYIELSRYKGESRGGFADFLHPPHGKGDLHA